jgi:DAD family
VDKANRVEFPEISPERYILSHEEEITDEFRAFADFVFSSIVLHFFVVTFIG